MDKHRIDNILRVFRTLHRLKELPRQGFIYFGFKGDETDSIAEHSFVVTWIAYILAQQLKEANFPDTDDQFVRRVTKIALIHDWSEAVLGDLGYLVKSEKLAAIEKRAYEALVEILPLGGQEELTTLWNAYESRNSLESAIVKSADSLDAWFQGLATSTTWWPAWEDYNRKTENTLKEKCNQPELAEIFRRTSDLAKYPHVGIMLPHAKNTHLSDDDLRELIYFIKNIYNLKELPRHGFTIFGMKRSETDSFAGHMFTAASLSYLLSMEMEMSPEEQHKAIMTALIHDLPVAITGDASYDLQESAQDAWRDSENRAIKKLTTVLCKSSRNEIEILFK